MNKKCMPDPREIEVSYISIALIKLSESQQLANSGKYNEAVKLLSDYYKECSMCSWPMGVIEKLLADVKAASENVSSNKYQKGGKEYLQTVITKWSTYSE
jgi:hypothetical protein